MGKADELLRKLGGNMSESIGMNSTVVNGEPLDQLPVNTSAKYAGRRRSRDMGEIDINQVIVDPDQPRKTFDNQKLQRLSDNIRTNGLLQAIVVRWSEEHNKWMLVSGERRFRASKMAEKETIRCYFLEEELNEETIRKYQLIENCQREDLLPIEQAKAFQALIEMTAWSRQRLATELNLSKASVVRSLALLKLPADVQQKVEAGTLTASAAYTISTVHGEPQQRKLASEVSDKGLSRDETIRLTRNETPAENEGESHLDGTVRRFTLRNAVVTVLHSKPFASDTDLQESLLGAVKTLCRRDLTRRDKNGG